MGTNKNLLKILYRLIFTSILLLCACALMGGQDVVCVYAEESDSTNLGENESLLPKFTCNRNANDYSIIAQVVNSYLTHNDDGSYSRIEYSDGQVIIENYSADFKLVSQMEIVNELPLFGGFYEGKDYYFLVFGQENKEEDDEKEVIRIVRFTKDWERTGAASLYGANTILPFYAGSLRMTQKDDLLCIHTCHRMYTTEDGLNHQANLFFAVNVQSMEVTKSFYRIGSGGVYVSHSFNQFLLITDDYEVRLLDHGDAYPRAIQMEGYPNNTYILKIQGINGANKTGVSIGGFEYSDTGFLVAGNSVDQSNEDSYDADGKRNIFIGYVDRQTNEVTLNWLTEYDEKVENEVSTPQFVKIDNSNFVILWSEGETVKYAKIDGMGNLLGKVYEQNLELSDCHPIVSDQKIVWYVTNVDELKFYSIHLNDMENVQIVPFRAPKPEEKDDLGKDHAGYEILNQRVDMNTNRVTDYNLHLNISKNGETLSFNWDFMEGAINYSILYKQFEEEEVYGTGYSTGKENFYEESTVVYHLWPVFFCLRVVMKDGTVTYSPVYKFDPSEGNSGKMLNTFMLGDVNGDYKISMMDIVKIRQYIVGGYGVELDEKAADVNKDGKISMMDVVWLRKFLVGGYGIVIE